jgi:predicted RNase H-like HicB family nuclease
MNKEFNVIIERDANGYFVASVPSIPGCHTQAKSLDELMERIKEAIELCLEVDENKPENYPLALLKQSNFIGCGESDRDLSSTYKTQLKTIF